MTDYTFLERATQLMPPCTKNQLTAIEAELKYSFPSEYRELLLTADGGMLTDTMVLYSAGTGIHPAETLTAANSGRDGLPLVFIGRFAEEEFGFARSDDKNPQRAVHVYMHETDETRRLSDSFQSLVERAIAGERF